MNIAIEEQEEYVKVSLINQGVHLRKRKKCTLENVEIKDINYRNLPLLNTYISDRGRIVPSRISGICYKKQRKLAQSIKRARNLGLLSFIAKEQE